MVKVQDPGTDMDCTSTVRTEYSHIAVVVDLQCEGSALFLSHVSLMYFRQKGGTSHTVSLSIYHCTQAHARTHTHWHKQTYCLSGNTEGKVKVHPRTGHEGPEVEYRYSSTLSLTSALDGGGWSRPRPGRVAPGKETRYPLYRGLGGSRDGLDGCRKSRPPPGFDPRTVQSAASRYTDWAIPADISK
jgi:hypothetical protein